MVAGEREWKGTRDTYIATKSTEIRCMEVSHFSFG